MHAVWVELPVKDIDRALAFYRQVFGFETADMVDDGVRRTATIVSTSPEGRPGISLNLTRNFEPRDGGVLVYLDAGPDLSAHLARVEPAGGAIVDPKTSMGEAGYYATFRDTENNVLALYSYQ